MSDATQQPSGWNIVRLHEVCRVRYGLGQPPASDGSGIPMVRATDIKNGRIVASGVVRVKREAIPHGKGVFLERGDIIVVRSGAYTGDVALYAGPWETAVAGYDLIVSPLTGDIDSEFLATFLRGNAAQRYFRSQRDRSAQPHLNADQLRNTFVPLAPISEQRAIARALRAVQEAKEARLRELTLERERKAALMEFLFTHGTRSERRELTELGEIPKSWEVTGFGDVCEFLQYGTSRKCGLEQGGLPVLGIPHVIRGRVETHNLRFMLPTENERRKLLLLTGDILFVRTNANRKYTGRCAVFDGEPREALFASYLIRARLKPDTLLPRFAQMYTLTSTGQSFLSGRASPAADGKFNINTQTIRRMRVPKPQINQQCEIIRTPEACETVITALENEFAILDEFSRAMLEELMTGRLSAVPLISEEAAS